MDLLGSKFVCFVLLLTHQYRNLHNYFSASHWMDLYGLPWDPIQHPGLNYTLDLADDSLRIHHGYEETLAIDVGDWHVYAAEWSPRGVTSYIDGQQIGPSLHEDIPNNFMTLIVNQALPDWLNPSLLNSLSYPSSFDMDYV